MPKYHNIFNEFRGLVFIQSEDPSKLPLNTSKTGLDIESPTLAYIRNKMIQTARPLINYLEKKYPEDVATITEIEDRIETREAGTEEEDRNIQVKHLSLDEIANDSVFKPLDKPKPAIKMSIIKYKRPKELVKKVKEYLGVKNNPAVGEATFDYFVDLEEIEYE